MIEAVRDYRIGHDLYILLLGILRGIQIKQQADKAITWKTEIDYALEELKLARQIDALYPKKEEIEARERERIRDSAIGGSIDRGKFGEDVLFIPVEALKGDKK